MIDSWTMTRRWAGILIAMMMIAVPAAASIITQNFMMAEVSVNDACFTKTPGADANNGLDMLVFDSAAVLQDPTGTVNLLQETMTIKGFAGDRLIYTEAAIFSNACIGGQLDVSLISENDPTDHLAVDPAYVTDGFWDDVEVSIYLGNNSAPAGIPGVSGEWTLVMRVVGGAVDDNINSVTIPEGSFRPMGVVIDTDDGITDGDLGILRWTAQAVHS